jgi:RNA polymerase sigma-70 factor (ECF subfamily)
MLTAMEELIERAKAGDAAALETLLARVAPAVQRFGRRMCGNEHDSDDVLQDTLVNVARHLSEFEGRSSFTSWVFAIARSACSHRRRGAKNRPPVPDDPVFAQADAGSSPEARAADRELVGQLVGALDRLAPDAREVLLLRDVEGLSAAEVAEALQITVDAVKSRLHRARAALKRELEPVWPAAAPAPGCPDAATLWSRKLEGELSQTDCAAMTAHVESCSACRTACDALKQALVACEQVAAAEVPADVQRRVKAAAQRWASER